GGFSDTNNSSTRARRGRTPTSPQGEAFTRGESSMLFVQPLFDGFDTRNRTQAAAARFDAAGSRIADSSESIGLRAVTAYLNVIRGRELVDLAETNVERHTDIVERIRIQVEGGGGSTADLDQASGRLALATSTLLQLRGSLRQGEAAYLEAVGEPVDTLVQPFDPDLPVPDQVDEALAAAVENNPTLAAAAAETRARANDVEAARAPFFPRVTFEVEGSRSQNIGGVAGPNNEATAMIVFNLNIFQGGAKRARTDGARARLSEARLRESEFRRGVEQNVRNSYAAFMTARERIPILESHVDSSERALDAYSQQFILGRRTLLDVLNVENEVFGAKASLLNGEINELLSQYQILTSLGRLLDTLGVAVGGLDGPTSQ
ncbi:MAG: TolC family outer membrane protein, partial [Proteobacteria bacterium]|nr:TolC family outer membrane protein [Pseudomonadota bacterium]